MKVRAIRLMDVMRQPIESSPYLTLGREYVVLSMEVSLLAKVPVSSANVLLINDEGERSASMFNLADFEITDDRPSRLWRVAFEELPGGRAADRPSYLLRLEPEAWLVPDFWQTFYRENPVVPVPDAIERFDATVLALHQEAELEWTHSSAHG
jgi:hypothetical protein